MNSFQYEYVYLTEKDSQKEDLAKILGCKSEGKWKPAYSPDKKIVIVPLRGHLFEVLSPEEYDPKFKTRYHPDTIYFFPKELKIKPKKDTQFLLNTAINILKKAKNIILAVDLDNEGAKLGADVIKAAGVENRVLKMIDTSSLTESALKKALSDDKNIPWKRMALAGQARAHIDYVEGISLSRALTFYLTKPTANGFYKNPLVFGGVKAPLMRMVVERDYEHENFKEIPYWYAEIVLEYEGKSFSGQLYKIEKEVINEGKIKKNETNKFFNKEEIEKIINKIKEKNKFFIDELDERIRKESPSKLYDFTSLSADVAKKRKALPNQVLDAAQELYMNLKIQTYPRTEVRYLRDEDYKHVPNVLKALLNSGIVKNGILNEIMSNPILKRKTVFDSSKVESHTAIIPTDNYDIPKIFNSLNNGDIKKMIFEMVVKRFVSNFLPDAETLIYQGKIIIDEDYFIFFKEEIPKKAGYKIVYDPDINGKISTYQRKIPNLVKGDEISVVNVELKQGFTSPPPRYNTSNIQTAMANISNLYKNDPTIKKFLGEHGIGTTATRAKIIEDMIKQGYFELEEKGKTVYIKSTKKAREQIKKMPEELSSPLKRAILSKYINDIVKGKITYEQLIKSYQKELLKQIEKIKEMAKDPNNIIINSEGSEEEKTLGKCPLCKDGEVIEKKKSFICNKSKLVKENDKWVNKGCSFTIWKNALERFGKKSITAKEVEKLLKNGKVKVTLYSNKIKKSYQKEIEIDLKFGVKVIFDSNKNNKGE